MSINELFLNPPRGIIDHSSSEMKKERALAQEKSAVSASCLGLYGEKSKEGRLTEA